MSDYIKVFFLPLMFLSPLSQSLTDLFSWNKEDANKKTLWQIVKGVIISAPFLIIFIILFSSADLIFDKYLSNIIDFKINREIVLRSLLIMAITLGFIGAYSYIFRFERKAKILKDAKDYNISFIEGYIVLGSVNILFFIFIAIQLAYLFGGEVSIISQGFTYAQYARRGFFELIAVAIISFLLLFGMDKFIPKKEEGYASIFKILASALILQVILIMISAHTRLTLYETAYGMTILRLYSHVFIVFLATIFFLMSYKIFRDRRENVFAFRVFAVAVLFLAFMNLFNPDAFIANRNIESFYATGKLDIHYLALLSDDALTASMKVFELPDQELKNNFSEELAKRAQEKKAPYFSRWQSLNISRMKGAKVLGQFLSAQ